MSNPSAPSTHRVWFITGSSTGFGRLLAERVLSLGYRAVITARKPEQLASLAQQYPGTALPLALDVTDQASITAAVDAATRRFGSIDVLVNNAGYGLVGAIEEPTDAEIDTVFATNVFGLLHVTRAVLPHMRQAQSGHILNLSSIGGLIATPGLGYYNATKFAVEGLSEALAGECAPLGIHVTVIEPGPFRTDFLGRSGVIAENVIPAYRSTAGKARQYFTDNDGKQSGDPAKAIQAMIDVVESANPPRHLLLGKSAFTRMQARLDQWHQELEASKEITLGADFAEEPAAAAH